LVKKMLYAASHAAHQRIPDWIRKPGAPPDNARIILAFDTIQACDDLGLSSGLHYVYPQSFAVELFEAVAAVLWPSGHGCLAPSSRRVFERMKRSAIVRSKLKKV
jgi:hypothetical protein